MGPRVLGSRTKSFGKRGSISGILDAILDTRSPFSGVVESPRPSGGFVSLLADSTCESGTQGAFSRRITQRAFRVAGHWEK
jgi:hypothetical protein